MEIRKLSDIDKMDIVRVIKEYNNEAFFEINKTEDKDYEIVNPLTELILSICPDDVFRSAVNQSIIHTAIELGILVGLNVKCTNEKRS